MRKVIEEIGNRYGKWVVIRQVKHPRGQHAQWLCRCDCGTERIIQGDSLRGGDSQSCGCLRRDRIIEEMVGRKFGRLIIIGIGKTNKWGKTTWLCKCECGNKIMVPCGDLRSGNTKSCGCLRIELGRNLGSKSLPKGEASFNQIFASMKRNAKRRKYQWALSKEQVRILTQQPCHYCGVEPRQGCLHRRYNKVYIYNGLDRVDNERGYIIDNVVPCCRTCNLAKFTKTTEEFKTWVRNIYEHFVKI